MSTYRVLVIPVALADPVREVVIERERELEMLQELVGGHLEAAPVMFQTESLVLYVDEEGLLKKGVPVNKHLRTLGFEFNGPVVLTNSDEEGEAADLPDSLTVNTWKTAFAFCDGAV